MITAPALLSSPLGAVATGVLVGLAVTQIAIFTTTVYLHRGLAHRALTLSAPLHQLSRAVIWLTTGIRPRQWAAVHRRHHAATDTPDDPHSPTQLGWVRVQLTNVALYRRAARDPRTLERYARDIPATRLDRLLYDHALVGLGLGLAALSLVLGWRVALIAGATHAVAYLALSGAVNAVGHTFGRRPHPNSATNLSWLAWLTAGEGLHNNHHAAPTAARFSFRRGEHDPAWPAVALARRLGWLQVRHDRPVLTTGPRARPTRTT